MAAVLAVAAPAIAVVPPAELRQDDVAIESGAQASDDDRAALEESASELAQAGRPTKYVVLAERPADPTAYARSIREAVRQPAQRLPPPDGGGAGGLRV